MFLRISVEHFDFEWWELLLSADNLAGGRSSYQFTFGRDRTKRQRNKEHISLTNASMTRTMRPVQTTNTKKTWIYHIVSETHNQLENSAGPS